MHTQNEGCDRINFVVMLIKGTRTGSDDDDYHHHNIDKGRLRLWTAAINVLIVQLPGDILALRTTVEWCLQTKTPDSFTRALWQSPQQSSGSKQEEREKGMMNLVFRSIFVHTCKELFTYREIYDMGSPALLPFPTKVC
jgi:hypothetical protein